MNSSNNRLTSKAFVRGLIVGILIIALATQLQTASALTNPWSSGVWTEGNPASATRISFETTEGGWPGGSEIVITFTVLSATGNGYFL